MARYAIYAREPDSPQRIAKHANGWIAAQVKKRAMAKQGYKHIDVVKLWEDKTKNRKHT